MRRTQGRSNVASTRLRPQDDALCWLRRVDADNFGTVPDDDPLVRCAPDGAHRHNGDNRSPTTEGDACDRIHVLTRCNSGAAAKCGGFIALGGLANLGTWGRPALGVVSVARWSRRGGARTHARACHIVR
jgi:hypothetical protein